MNNFYDTNHKFEQLLAQEADKYRMYPSDKVWNNVRNEMQGKKRWPALMLAFVFITVALTVTTVIFYPPHKEFIANNNNSSAKQEVVTTQQQPSFNIASNKVNKQQNKSFYQTATYLHNVANTIENTNEYTANTSNTLTKEAIAENNIATVAISETITQKATLTNIETTSQKTIYDNVIKSDVENILANNNGLKNSSQAENYLNNLKPTTTKKSKASKWQLQVYATPSVSYRVLEDDKTRAEFTSNPTDLQALNSNVNDIVLQKPAFGGEVGIALLYPITKNFFVKTGVQFNTRQYVVEASQQSGQANISYVENNQLNTMSFQSNYSTKQGANNVTLDNKVYQLSVPIGFQWNVIDNGKWGVALGATIQPTVTLNKSIYLVSTDYKYYTDGTPFFRKMNVNTSTELLLTLKSGKNKWVFGPQIRYQQMPTYNDLYPVKEYRVDYGIKIGFVKNL